VRRRLEGEVIDTVPDHEDWPRAGDTTPAGWEAIRRELDDRHARLEGVVAALPESRLGDAVAARPYDVQYMLHGILQHTLYHAGQIALLKKAAEEA
jgi:DinB family protein